MVDERRKKGVRWWHLKCPECIVEIDVILEAKYTEGDIIRMPFDHWPVEPVEHKCTNNTYWVCVEPLSSIDEDSKATPGCEVTSYGSGLPPAMRGVHTKQSDSI